MNGIARETFEQMDDTSKLNVLFDYVVESVNNQIILKDKIETRRKFDTTCAAIFGFIGGMVAHLGQLVFWKNT